MPVGLHQRVEGEPVWPEEQHAGTDEKTPAQVRARLSRLTPRERQVMQFIVSGMTSKQIAEQFGLSPRTIEVHRAHLMLKMGTKSLTQLVRWAVVCGLDESDYLLKRDRAIPRPDR